VGVNRGTRLVVLLRGINVGGRNRIPMAELRTLLTELGASSVATHLQSGQAVLDVADDEVGGFAGRVHEQIQRRLGLDIDVLVRTREELAAIVAANPYPRLESTPKRLHVSFLDRTPDPETVAAAGTAHGGDEFAVGDRVLYLAFSGSSHDSPLLPVLRRLGGVQTARNWTTVTAVMGLCDR
jgi:uncharacterized protein (DUF1697 family)